MQLDLNKDFEAAAQNMSTPTKTPTTLSELGFSSKKTLTKKKYFFCFCLTAIKNYLELDPDDENKYNKCINEYLEHPGIKNKKILSLTKEFKDPLATEQGNKITPAIRNGFAQLSIITRVAKKENYCFEDPDKIDLADEWTTCLLEAQEARKSVATKANAPASNSTDTKKFPTFKLKPFINYKDNVEKFLETVHNNFTEN